MSVNAGVKCTTCGCETPVAHANPPPRETKSAHDAYKKKTPVATATAPNRTSNLLSMVAEYWLAKLLIQVLIVGKQLSQGLTAVVSVSNDGSFELVSP